MLKPWASFFNLHCSSSFSCINEYLAIDKGGYVYEQPSHINYSIWLDASQRSWDGVWLNRSAGEVKYISALSSPDDWILCWIRNYLYFLPIRPGHLYLSCICTRFNILLGLSTQAPALRACQKVIILTLTLKGNCTKIVWLYITAV